MLAPRSSVLTPSAMLLRRRRNLVAQAWSPLSLFAAGEQGGWYDPTDLTTMFQDSAGTTPVTAVEQPVGRLLDKSGRGNHLIQPTSASRPTYSKRYNLLLATATLSTQSVTVTAGSHTLSFAGAGSITLSGTGSGTYNAGTHTITTTAGSLTLTVSGAVTTADLRRTIHTQMGMPAYQRVTTATDYDEAGFLPRVRVLGGDDGMYTAASVDFSGTDEVTVLAGLTKLSDASAGIVVETSANSGTTSGTFYVAAPIGASDTLGFRCGGSIPGSLASVGSVPAPATAVVTGLGDISADTSVLRRNGAQVASSASDQGTGNFGNHVLNVGRRNNASLPFEGDIFQLIVRGALTSGADLTSAEQYVAARTGVTL